MRGADIHARIQTTRNRPLALASITREGSANVAKKVEENVNTGK